jgi:hypothetical protein
MNRGFTFAETIVVVALLVLMSSALISMYLSFNTFFHTNNASFDATRSASQLMRAIHEASLQANGVSNSRTVSGTTYTSASTTLVLEVPSIGASGQVVAGAYDFIIIHATSSSAYYIVDPDISSTRKAVQRTLSTVLTNLTFAYNGSPIESSTKVDVALETASTYKDQVRSALLSQQIYFRN